MVIHGMVGSSQRADFTVIGDPVNIAARLCGMAKRGQSLVCDCTFGRISDSGTVVLKASSEAGAARAEDRVSARSGTIASDGFTFVGPYKANLKGKIEAQRVYLLAGIPGTMMGADDGTA
jgi:class 3 adenylate cyclase